jgi:hypothetical protein
MAEVAAAASASEKPAPKLYTEEEVLKLMSNENFKKRRTARNDLE